MNRSYGGFEDFVTVASRASATAYVPWLRFFSVAEVLEATAHNNPIQIITKKLPFI